MDITLLQEGCIVMVIGMGTVFLFLTVMILAMDISTYLLKFINKYFPEETPMDRNMQRKKSLNEEEIAAAIVCAIREQAKHNL